jgi:hypothetical protein
MQAEQTPELLTEVTSIAQEEAKTGETVAPPMTPEQLVSKAHASFYRSRRDFAQVFISLSSRGKMRVMNAVLDLPTPGLKVLLKENNEKLAFRIGQQIIQDRFLITQYHIGQEVKKMREEKAAKEAAATATEQTTQETAPTINEGEVK